MTNEDKAKLIYSITGDVERFTQAITGDNQVTVKYKLIDILNKIVNDELEDGTKVIYQGMEFVYDGKDLACVGDFDIYFYIDDKEDLKEVVEVIEPDDDVKKVETTDNTKIEELELEDMIWHGGAENILSIAAKINEVICKLNKED